MSTIFAKAQIDNEPGNNAIPGDNLTMPVNNNATLTSSTDVDYFKITTTTYGVLIIAVNGTNSSMKTRIQIFNSSSLGSEGYRDAVFAGATDTMEILTQYVGDYFIKVSNINTTTNSSPYTLTVSLDSSDTHEFNDDATTASLLPSISYDESNPTVVQGKIRGYYRTNSGSGWDQYVNLSADQDWYKVNITTAGVLILNLVGVPSNLKFRMQVLNSGGGSEAYRDASINGDSLRMEYLTPTTGAYFIRLSNINGNANGAGNTSPLLYSLNVSMDTTDNHEFNDNSASATLLPPISYDEANPSVVQGKIRGYYRTNSGSGWDQYVNLSVDQDWYKVNLLSAGVLVLNLVGVPSNLKFRMQVLNSGGGSEAYRDASVNGDSLRMEYLAPSAGAYFIRLSNINGNANGAGNTSALFYSLNLSLDTTDIHEFNDDAASAYLLPSISYDESNPTVIQGKIRGYYRTNSGSGWDQYVNLSVDQDWYKINVTTMGVIVLNLVNVPSNLQFRMQVLNAAGGSEGYRDASISGDTLRFEYLTPIAGAYFIRLSNINGNANGGGNTSSLFYTLNLSVDSAICEFNNNASLACVISANDSVYGKIRGHWRTNSGSGWDQFVNLSTDVDYYKPDSCGNFLYARVSNVPSNLKIKITVYDNTGTNSLGSKTAVLNGDTVRINAADLTNAAAAKYYRIENVNSGNATNTSPDFYTLFVARTCSFTGIEESLSSLNISMYPNPSKDNLTIELPEQNNQQASVSIIDLLGEQLYQQKFSNQSKLTIDVKDLPSGIYFVQIANANGKGITKKFIKE